MLTHNFLRFLFHYLTFSRFTYYYSINIGRRPHIKNVTSRFFQQKWNIFKLTYWTNIHLKKVGIFWHYYLSMQYWKRFSCFAKKIKKEWSSSYSLSKYPPFSIFKGIAIMLNVMSYVWMSSIINKKTIFYAF